MPGATFSHRVLQGAAQRGAQFYLIFAVLRTLLHAAKWLCKGDLSWVRLLSLSDIAMAIGPLDRLQSTPSS